MWLQKTLKNSNRLLSDTISYFKHSLIAYLGISCVQKLQGISYNL